MHMVHYIVLHIQSSLIRTSKLQKTVILHGCNQYSTNITRKAIANRQGLEIIERALERHWGLYWQLWVQLVPLFTI